MTTVGIAGENIPAADLEKVIARAYAAPFDDDAFDRLVAILPKIGEIYYIIEGDLVLTRDELRRFLSAAGDTAAVEPGPELRVGQSHGKDVVWPKNARALRYWVDTSTFGDVATANLYAEALEAGAKSWIDACSVCGLSLRRTAKRESSDFTLAQMGPRELRDLKGARLLAAAFFPNAKRSRRTLWVNHQRLEGRPPGQLGFTTVGVMRHEFGHILGYVHEHIVPEAIRNGCRAEASVGRFATAPDASRSIDGEYHPESVMHKQCGGVRTAAAAHARSQDFDPRLSKSDKDLHRVTYK